MEFDTLETPSGVALHERLTGETLVCGLLGKILYTYPERAWIGSLAAEAVFDEIPFSSDAPETGRGLELLQTWSRESKNGLSDDAFDVIRADYTRLFIGPAKLLAPPWESVSLSLNGLTFQEETLAVRRWYARHGLQFEKLHNEPDDHVGLELAFVAHLTGMAIRALENEDKAAYERAVRAQQDFLSEHLLRWGPGWSGHMAESAATSFYQGVGWLTKGTLIELQNMIPAETREASVS